MRRTFLEAVVFLAAACIVALTVNARRGNGLTLSRNYFPPIQAPPQQHPGTTNVVADSDPGATEPDAAEPEFIDGYQAISLQQTHAYYEQMYDQGDASIVFIDARADEPYQECRIPGAIQFNYYHPENYVSEVQCYASAAETVIIYCNGGDCEDSRLASQYLTTELEPVLDFDKIFVFKGGIQEWHQAGYPKEPEGCAP